MNTHPYLRAYMAGIFVPSLFLLVVLTAFVVARIVFRVPIPIERVIVFPMAIVPNLFGLWNVLYVSLKPRRHLPIGFHGAILPLIMAPVGVLVGCSLGVLTIGAHGIIWFEVITAPYYLIAPWFFVALAVYYLVWKYIVGFLNQVLGIA
jgi:hypothetical protein